MHAFRPRTCCGPVMDCRTALLSAAVAVQLFSAVDEVRTLLADEKAVGHMQTLLTNVVSVVSTVLTVACGDRLRRVRRSLDRVEQSVRPVRDAVDAADGRSRTRAWLAAAVVAFGYLKYGQLTVSDSGRAVGENAYANAAVASLRTISVAGNYYVTAIFVDHVTSARRSVQQSRAAQWSNVVSERIARRRISRILFTFDGTVRFLKYPFVIVTVRSFESTIVKLEFIFGENSKLLAIKKQTSCV